MKTKTFSSHIFSQILWLSLSLFSAFIFILWILSFQITELTIASLSELEAKNLKDKRHTEVVNMYASWDEMPLKYQILFDKSEAKKQVTLEKLLPKSEKIAYLYTYINAQGNANYLLSIYDEKDIQKITDDIFLKSLSTIALTTLIIFVILFFILRWLITRTSQPYKKLHTWIKTIQDKQEHRAKINFYIEEIDNIAFELEDKIETIQAYAKREKAFLKYTSHELRTPLSIIQASLDTLNELNSNKQSQKTLNRALKASNNIQITSSALLYLARESNKPIKKTTIDIQVFIEDIINDHRYLLEDKDVKVIFNSYINEVLIEEDFFFVIVSNLIKNAFTYCEEGKVTICFDENSFTIENKILESNKPTKEIGFSLGLKLVELICEKLSYSLDIKEENQRFFVTIKIS